MDTKACSARFARVSSQDMQDILNDSETMAR